MICTVELGLWQNISSKMSHKQYSKSNVEVRIRKKEVSEFKTKKRWDWTSSGTNGHVWYWPRHQILISRTHLKIERDFDTSIGIAVSCHLGSWLATFIGFCLIQIDSAWSYIHAFFFIRILFIRIIGLRSGKNKNNLRIIKAQILP